MFIQGVLKSKEEDTSDALMIRRKVFQDELAIEKSLEEDNTDINDISTAIVYEVAYHDNCEQKKAVATGRIGVFDDHKYKIGRIAVLPDKRGNGYGEMIVRMLAFKAFDLGAEEVFVSAQIHAIGFYEKLGFVSCGIKTKELNKENLVMKLQKENITKKCKSNQST